MSVTQLPVKAIPEPVIPEMDDEEPLSERRERQYILSALWAVVLLGLPIWWSTTTTQRLSLPSAQVKAWRDVSVGAQSCFCRVFGLHISCGYRPAVLSLCLCGSLQPRVKVYNHFDSSQRAASARFATVSTIDSLPLLMMQTCFSMPTML